MKRLGDYGYSSTRTYLDSEFPASFILHSAFIILH